MTISKTRIRLALAGDALLFSLAVAGAPASAQQPNSVNPNADAVKEQQLLAAIRAAFRVSAPSLTPSRM